MRRVSVVVPTRRRPELLNRCLSALAEQELSRSMYEVVVVDDGPSEDTRGVVEAWKRHCPDLTWRYIPMQDRHGPAAARNVGWRSAVGDVIAFTDDDCIPARTWLAEGLSAFSNGVIGVSGRIIVPLPPRPTDYERDAARLQHARFATANCFYWRNAIAAAGGFDEDFTMAWREDSELFFRLLTLAPSNGSPRLVTVDSAVVIHPIRPAPWGISLSQQRKSMFNALLFKKHPDLYRQELGSVTPWHYYGAVGALVTALVSALVGQSLLARASVIIWGLLTAAFCIQRLRHTSHAPQHIMEMIVTSILIPPFSVFWRLRGAYKYRVVFL